MVCLDFFMVVECDWLIVTERRLSWDFYGESIIMATEVTKRSNLQQALCTLVGMILFLSCFVQPAAGTENLKLKHDLFSVSFPSEGEGWVCGRLGTIAHTSNGGSNWTLQESGITYTLTSICFVDPKNGWVVGDGGTILHTQDGGKTWIPQKSPSPVFFMDVQFVNDHKGWIVGEGTTILHTEDGGNSWQIQFQDEDFILKSISFCDALNGWTVGEFGYIYNTKDGGETWQKQGGYFGFSEESGDIKGGNFLFDAVAISPLECWIVGIDGYISKTADGGVTWEKTENTIPRTHIFSIAVDSKESVMIGGNGLLMVNSGENQTFREFKTAPPITYGWIYGLSLRGHDGGFVAVGKGGRIYLSEATKAVGN
jgi:photosystem II stability/assembly factor-like uncharacterized protein